MKFVEIPRVELLHQKTRITLDIDNRWRQNALTLFGKIKKDKDFEISIKQKRNKRSHDANSYAWVLIGKIAQAINTSAIAVYRNIISDMYAYQVIQVQSDLVERWQDLWESRGYGWITMDWGVNRMNPEYHDIQCFYGSSEYNSKEMADFIDKIIAECKELDIEYLPEYELKRMLEEWK